MDSKKNLIEFKRRQRRKLLKKLQVIEPIQKAKELLKQTVEKAIEQQEIVKQRVGEKQKENINKFKELRSAFPELSDMDFTRYAREQLGLDVPKSSIAKLPKKERERKLKEKLEKQPKPREILVDLDVEKRQKADIEKQKGQLQELELVKKGQLDLLKSEINNVKQRMNDILKDTKLPLKDLEMKYAGKGNQGRMTEDKRIFREYQKLEQQLRNLEMKLPVEPKKFNITKKKKAKEFEDVKPAMVEEVKPTMAEENIPDIPDIKQYSKKVEDLRVDVAKQLANLKNAKNEAEKEQFLNIINNLSMEIKNAGEKDLSDVVDSEAIEANREWEMANKEQKNTDDDMDIGDLFGKGLRPINKKNINLYHVYHGHVKDMGGEFVLSKKGMEHAGNMAKILKPKEFEKMLTVSLFNHVKKNRK